MSDQEVEETRDSLYKVQKTCKLLSVIMKAVFGFFCLWWLLATILMCLSLIGMNGSLGAEDIDIVGILLFVGGGAVIATILLTLIGIFSETAQGQSPFMMVQVCRLRRIACMLLVYAILDMLISYNAALLHYDWANPGSLMVTDPFVTINAAPIIAAAVVFAFSFVFKYGVLLQEFSDDAI